MDKNMKKHFLFSAFLTAVILLICACNDPVFYAVHMDEKILEPYINGSPTNLVVYGTEVYVASGRNLFEYKSNKWSSPPGLRRASKILQLAATTGTPGKLYALCEGSGRAILWSYDGTSWENITGSHNIQTIYAAGTQLFVGTGTHGAYNIIRYNGITFSSLGSTGSRLLNGAAFAGGTYYLSTNGGIYTTDLSTPFTIIGDDHFFMGIIGHGSDVYAITRSGNLYNVTAPFGDPIASLGGRLATGALAIWTSNSGDLLLAGRQETLAASMSSGYTFGYMEYNLSGGSTFREPGPGSLSTVDSNERYKSTIGKVPVQHILQAPAPSGVGVLFASTQKDGVWSYRVRGGVWQWNAEQ